jgi:GABA permease
MTDVLTPPTTALLRVLVVVDDACTAPDLCASVRAVAAGRPIEALVVAPAHGGAFAQWYVDEDAARAEATHRLRACLECLAGNGIQVLGHLGDADPVQAIADALYEFDAEEILLVTAAGGPSRWLRPSVAERVRRTFAQPVHLVAMPPERSRR